MHNVRLLIVEDDPLQCEKMENLAEDLGYEVVQTAGSAGEAINLINSVQPDVLIMDIHLDDDLDGIDVVKKAKPETDFALIYVTSLSDYETLERSQATDPDAYLIKPVSEPQLKSAVELAVFKRAQNQKLLTKEFQNRENFISGVLNKSVFVKIGDLLKKIAFDEILYFQASKDKYCDIVTRDKTITARTTLSELAEVLPDSWFLRIHRSAIVNLKHVQAVNKDYVLIDETLKVPLGKTFKQELYSKMRVVG